MILKKINEKTYKVIIGKTEIISSIPVYSTINILKGIIGWYRHGMSILTFEDDSNKTLLVMSAQNSYLIDEDNASIVSKWPRFKESGLSQQIADDIINDIQSRPREWALFSAPDKEDFSDTLDEILSLLDFCNQYRSATIDTFNSEQRIEIEKRYLEYLKSIL